MQDTFGDAYQMQLHWGLTREMETAISNLGQEKCNKAPCLLLLTGALCATCEWLHPATAEHSLQVHLLLIFLSFLLQRGHSVQSEHRDQQSHSQATDYSSLNNHCAPKTVMTRGLHANMFTLSMIMRESKVIFLLMGCALQLSDCWSYN